MGYFAIHLCPTSIEGGGPRVVVSTGAFHGVRGSVPGLGGLKDSIVKDSIVESLRDREVACSASDRQGSNFESCVWRTVSSQSSHHPQEVLLAQFSLYVHKGGLKPDSFHLQVSNLFFYCLDKKYFHVDINPIIIIIKIGIKLSNSMSETAITKVPNIFRILP